VDSLPKRSCCLVVTHYRLCCSNLDSTPASITTHLPFKQLFAQHDDTAHAAPGSPRSWLPLQALFGNLGSHKLGPAIEARAEVLQAEAGGDSTKQVRYLLPRSLAAGSSAAPRGLLRYLPVTHKDVEPATRCLICLVRLFYYATGRPSGGAGVSDGTQLTCHAHQIPFKPMSFVLS